MPRMTARPVVEEAKRDPRLEKVAGFGRSIAQPPLQLPVDDHKGFKADHNAILRSKKHKLIRRYAEQRISRALRLGMSISKDLLELAKFKKKVGL